MSFYQKAENDIEEVARSLNLASKEIKERISELHEENPMLGHRVVGLESLFQRFMRCNAGLF